MVPVSLHGSDGGSSDGGGNAVGVVMCNLGTHLHDAGERLATVHRSMEEGKAALRHDEPAADPGDERARGQPAGDAGRCCG